MEKKSQNFRVTGIFTFSFLLFILFFSFFIFSLHEHFVNAPFRTIIGVETQNCKIKIFRQ